jgi:hypothetical protein
MSLPSAGSTDCSWESLRSIAPCRARAAFRHIGGLIPIEQRTGGAEIADLAQAALELLQLGLDRPAISPGIPLGNPRARSLWRRLFWS